MSADRGRNERDAEGNIVGEHYKGCDGRARASRGHLPRDAVMKAKLINAGTGVWEVEFECQRPTTSGMVYDPVKVQAAVAPLESLARPSGRSAGRWASTGGPTAVAVLAERHGSYVAIREGRVFDGESMAKW
jgi:hypothetical protein